MPKNSFYKLCENGDLKTIRETIEKNELSIDNKYAVGLSIIYACQYGHLEVVKYLFSQRKDSNYLNSWYTEEAFLCSCRNGHLELVKYLLEIGVQVDFSNNRPIRLTCTQVQFEIVKFLLSKGADFNVLSPKQKRWFRMKKAYSRWRKVYLRNWIRRVLIPLYFSPQNRGGIQAKKDLENILGCE